MSKILAWPVTVDAAGRLATVPAGSDAHAQQAADILALTRPGHRPAKPDMGTPDPVGQRDYDTAALQAAADRWAPFAEIVDVVRTDDGNPAATVEVTARVRAR